MSVLKLERIFHEKKEVNEWLLLGGLLPAQTEGRIPPAVRRRSSVNPITASLVLATFLFTATFAGAAPTLTVIHTFSVGNGDDPNGLIQASDGNFYGINYLGVGTVFQVTPAGKFTTVFTLPPQNPNRFFYGDYFTRVVEGPDGFLYVTARGSNSNPNPMVFRISKSGSDYQVVLQEAPYGLSVASDGNFYGSDGNGIFRLTTAPAPEIAVHTERSSDMLRSLHQQRAQIRIAFLADMQLRLALSRVSSSRL